MRRALAIGALLAISAAALLQSGCGPGLVALGGGGVGGYFALKDGDKKKDNPPPPPATNLAPAVVVTSLIREESPATLNYTLIDANLDLCSVTVQYSTGGPFQNCTEGAGGDGTTGLNSSAIGVPHSFSWDFLTDLSGPDYVQGLSVRVQPNDGTVAGSFFTLSGLAIGNDAPVIGNIQVIGDTDVLLITFDLADQASDLGSLVAGYSIDQGQNFVAIAGADIIGNPPSNLLTSPAGSAGQFIWNSAAPLPNFQGTILLIFFTSDQPAGYSSPSIGAPVVAGPFPLSNSVNGPPELTVVSSFLGETFTAEVSIGFTIEDQESDAAVLYVQYRITNPITMVPGAWILATLRNQFAQGIAGPFQTIPSPTFYAIVWDALADLASPVTVPIVDLQLTPADGTLGASTVTDVFRVIGNEAPIIQAIAVLQDSGNVPIVLTVVDSTSDPVEATIEYSTNGTTYNPLPPSAFIFGDPRNLNSSPFGEQNTLIWDSSITFPSINAASVTLRVTPKDHPPSATPAGDLTGSPAISAPFPIINDPGSADPVSIDILETSGPSAVTVPFSGTRNFSRVVNPGGATVTNTLWFVDEGPSHGTVITGGGAFATGTITADTAANMTDGETFTIDNGLGGVVTFEFDNNFAFGVLNLPVDISTAVTAADVAAAISATINGVPLGIFASITAPPVVDLVHFVAAGLTNQAIIHTSAAAGFSVTGMSGGAGGSTCVFTAPATAPGGATFVTIRCTIDDPGFTNVSSTYRLYFGETPTGVNVTPAGATVLLNSTQLFTGAVLPAGAPQLLTWEVEGGAANGTINNTGLYFAPSSLPSGNPVTIRAYSVDPSAPVGTATVTLVPEPQAVIVTSPLIFPPELLLGNSVVVSSTVLPGAAPQTVTWRIIWAGQDRGSGDATVGTLTPSGSTATYVAPAMLPSPDFVDIEAVSTVNPSVFGSYQIRLIAPDPTGFQVIPPASILIAGGAGVQHDAVNFVPANANQSVTWELSPVIGAIDSSGYYTPPATVSGPTAVTVTARSTVAPTVTASAVVTVNPGGPTPPTGVTITPGEGITHSSGPSVALTAVVAPGGASQAVTWTVVTPAAFGAIDSSGLYTPPPTAVDVTVTIRATAVDSPNPFDEVDVCVTGDGVAWDGKDDLVMGRGQASSIWDPVNNRFWIIGGNSEESGPTKHEATPLYFDEAANTWNAFASIPTSAAANSIVAVYDDNNTRILALVGDDLLPVEIWELDVNNLGAGWQQINYGLAGNSAKFDIGNHRYQVIHDEGKEELYVLKTGSIVFRFKTDSDVWKSLRATGGTRPDKPELLTYIYDIGNDKHFFVGPETESTTDTTLWNWDEGSRNWDVIPTQGTAPAGGLRNAGGFLESDIIHLFGGQLSQGGPPVDLQYTLDLGVSPPVWSPQALTGEIPAPRAEPVFALSTFSSAVYMYGGVSDLGSFGDLWEFDYGSFAYFPSNPDGIRPQGRVNAASVFWDGGGEGFIYGGKTDAGVSKELWKFIYDDILQQVDWFRIETFGSRPPPLQGSGMVWHTSADVALLFGGTSAPNSSGSYTNGLWSFDPLSDTWSSIVVAGAPSARHSAAVCFDDNSDTLWVFGGEDSTGFRNDLYSFNAASPGWSPPVVLTGTPPDERIGATCGFDTRKNRLLIVGGDSVVSGPNRQLFAADFAAGSWSVILVLNPGIAKDVFEAATVYTDDCTRFISAPGNVPTAQAAVLATPDATWQSLLPPGANNYPAASGLYDPTLRRYFAVFGRRPLGGGVFAGTNTFRTMEFQ